MKTDVLMGVDPDAEVRKAYKVLGVRKTATLKKIKAAYRAKAMIYHPDKPEADANKFTEVNEAYEVLLADRSKFEPRIPIASRKNREPDNYAMLCRWLEDLGIHNPVIWRNMRELMIAKRFSYMEFESMSSVDFRIVRQVILLDTNMTQQFCNGIPSHRKFPHDKHERVLDVIEGDSLSYTLIEEDLARMTNAGGTSPNDEERLFLYILTLEKKQKQGETKKSAVNLCPFPTDKRWGKSHEGWDARMKALGLQDFLYKRFIGLVRDYRSKIGYLAIKFSTADSSTTNSSDQDPSALEQLQLELIHINEVMTRERTLDVFKPVYEQWVAPIENLISLLNKKTDKDSQIRVQQLSDVLTETNKIVQNEVIKRLGSSVDLGLKQQGDIAKAEFFKKIIDLKDEYIQKKTICGHRNKIGAILKTVGCWFVTCLTLGIAARVFDGVRHGLFYRTRTQATLLDQYETLRELHRKADPEHYRKLNRSAKSNPYVNALTFRCK